MLFISALQNSVTYEREIKLLCVASSEVAIVKPQLLTFNCFPFELGVKIIVKMHLKFL